MGRIRDGKIFTNFFEIELFSDHNFQFSQPIMKCNIVRFLQNKINRKSEALSQLDLVYSFSFDQMMDWDEDLSRNGNYELS